MISARKGHVLAGIPRRGVSIRDGSYDPQTREFTASDPPNAMSNFTYMSDQMGNVAALVTCARGIADRQVFDAFGNIVGGGGNSYITFRCASDFDNGEWTVGRVCNNPPVTVHDCEDPLAIDCDPPCPDPLPDAKPIERMQTGGFNWRGNEGSITDRNAEDQRAKANPDILLRSAYTQPSTGLVYMQARYYEPETGRFTQADALPYGLEAGLCGQNNRWTYCGSDPVNCSDPSGNSYQGLMFGIGAAIGFGMGAYLGFNLATGSQSSLLIATLLGIANLVGTVAIDSAIALGTGNASLLRAGLAQLANLLGGGQIIADVLLAGGISLIYGFITGLLLGLGLGALVGAVAKEARCAAMARPDGESNDNRALFAFLPSVVPVSRSQHPARMLEA